MTSCISDLFGPRGKGEIVSEIRTAQDFNTIEVKTLTDVEIKKDSIFKVEVSDYENIVQYTLIEVVSNKLIISIDPAYTLLSNSKAKVIISIPDSLISVTLKSSGDISVLSAFKDLETISINGSANISTAESLDVDSLSVSISGSGNITAKGKATNLTASISGSVNLYMYDLIAVNAKCTITGSGNIQTNVSGTLQAIISGSGNIKYLGNPTVVSQNSGFGNISKK